MLNGHDLFGVPTSLRRLEFGTVLSIVNTYYKATDGQATAILRYYVADAEIKHRQYMLIYILHLMEYKCLRIGTFFELSDIGVWGIIDLIQFILYWNTQYQNELTGLAQLINEWEEK
jgi:hypothetical protein